MAPNGNDRSRSRRGIAAMVAMIVAAGGAAPVLLYWLLLGRVPTVTPQEAKRLLREPDSTAILVDVRPPEQFSAGHLDGAVNWPRKEVLSASVPERFRGKTLLLVCNVGWASGEAAAHLASPGGTGVSPVPGSKHGQDARATPQNSRVGPAGPARAVNVRGGIQEWIRSAAIEQNTQCLLHAGGDVRALLRGDFVPKGEDFDRWRVAPDRVVELPFRPSPLFEQAVAVLAFFVVKPVYTLMALAVAIVLWKSRSPDLAALRWGMIFFFLGENACAANYFLFKETSYLAEYLHSYGMLLCFGFTAYALLEGVDRRVLMLSPPDRRCAAMPLCIACVKHAEVPCGLKRTFYLILPALIVLALMLPTADWRDNAYNTAVFGQLYNYAHLRVYQVFENWYCGAAAMLMFSASLGILLLKRHDPIGPAKVFLAAGAGPLGFGMLRMVLGGAYDENRVWYLFWEETTELVFLLGVCFVLWSFRRGLLGPRVAAWVPGAQGSQRPVSQ